MGSYDFLLREVADRLADCLLDIKRDFPLALDLGCHGGQLAEVLAGRGGIGEMVQCDLSHKMVAGASGPRLVADEEALPFANGQFDLVASVLSLHWVNDLPGTFSQIRRALKPNGLFLCAVLGAGSLDELRQAMLAAEIEVRGGASPRVSPFMDARDAGSLLQRAGFALPVVDTDRIVLSYPDPFALMAHSNSESGFGFSVSIARLMRAFPHSKDAALRTYGPEKTRAPPIGLLAQNGLRAGKWPGRPYS